MHSSVTEHVPEPWLRSACPSSLLLVLVLLAPLLSAGGKLVGGAAAGWFRATSEARKGFPDMFEDYKQCIVLHVHVEWTRLVGADVARRSVDGAAAV